MLSLPICRDISPRSLGIASVSITTISIITIDSGSSMRCNCHTALQGTPTTRISTALGVAELSNEGGGRGQMEVGPDKLPAVYSHEILLHIRESSEAMCA